MYRASADEEEGVRQTRATPRECEKLYIGKTPRKTVKAHLILKLLELARPHRQECLCHFQANVDLPKEETGLWKSDCAGFAA